MSALACLNLPWDPEAATHAYLETIGLRGAYKDVQREIGELVEGDRFKPEPDSTEFVSALAAGTSACRIVEVGSGSPLTTLALAAAAKQAGGQLISFVYEDGSSRVAARQALVEKMGLGAYVQFEPDFGMLRKCTNVQFALVDCHELQTSSVCLPFIQLDRNGALILAHNLFDLHLEGEQGRTVLADIFNTSSIVLPIGNGLEVLRLVSRKELEDEPAHLESSPMVEVSA